HLLPCFSAIVSAVQTGLLTKLGRRITAGKRIAAHAVGSSIQNLWLPRIDGNIDESSILVDVLDLLPGQAAILGLVQTPFFVRSPHMAERRNINDIWICRMNDDPANVVAVAQSHVLPSLAAVDRLVDTVAPRNAVARVGFSRADPNNLWVRRR